MVSCYSAKNIARTFETGMEIFQNAGISCNLLKLMSGRSCSRQREKGLGGVFCMPMFEENKSVEMKQEEFRSGRQNLLYSHQGL